MVTENEGGMVWDFRGMGAEIHPEILPKALITLTHGNGTLRLSMSAKDLRGVAEMLTTTAARLEDLH